MNLYALKVYEQNMKEETKEEYLSRHRKQLAGKSDVSEEPLEEEISPVMFKDRLKKWFLLLLFACFIWAIYQFFGMLKAN